jgi:hypothetical protein
MTDAVTLTDLYGDIYKKMDVVSRELVGFIPSVSVDGGMDRAAKNQPIRTFVSSAKTAADFTPGQLPPTVADNSFSNVYMEIQKERIINLVWNGNDQRRLDSSYGWRSLFLDDVEQGLRTLTNEMEADLWAAAHVAASRAAAPAGTNLFDAANYKDIANVRKILADNGAPLSDVSLVLDTTAGAAFRGNAQYYGANTAGSADWLRQGVMMDIHGVKVRESAAISAFTVGTGASATTNNAGYAVGDTVLTLASAGTGTIKAGDVIVITGDASAAKYVVVSGDADVSGGGTITIAAPGLRGALSAATHAITIDASTTHNVILARNAIHMATRLLPIPEGGDSAKESMVITDPRSGMNFDLRKYVEYGQVRYILGCSWGVKVIKPEHSALLID